jgi:curli biogenesis system outer membrane secretion channel CsgG
MNKKLYLILILAVIVVIFSCAQKPSGTVYVKNGKQYGKVAGTFRHRWWNYYERGVSYADGEFYAEAVSDFKEAIRQRERDQRRARTYGMHLVDYFPHRELGIVHYFIGDLQSAQQELELSLMQFPSAKARFYRDRVRKNLIEKQKKAVPPPILNLDIRTERIWTKADPVVISGVAEDDNYINRLTINNTLLFMQGAQKIFRFEEKLALSQGRHTVEIEVENLIGKITKQTLTIQVDREGPTIVVDQIELKDTATGKEVLIGGSIFDEAGVSELTIYGRRLAITRGVEVSFAKKLALDKDELEVIAKDTLKNQTTARISLSSFKTGGISRIMLACSDCDEPATRIAGIFGLNDTRPPEILLKGWTGSQTVFQEKIYLEGQVRDQNKIVDLLLNDKQILRRRGNIIFFNRLVELAEGENILAIKAGDEKGNSAQKVITVVRRIPKVLQLNERLSMTVLPFEQKGELSEISNSFQDYLINDLVNRNRFNMVERTKLEAILEEQKLSRTKLFDEKTALKLGRLIASQVITAGSIVSSRTGVEIIARVIDTETSAILAAADVYDEVAELKTLRLLSEGLAVKFHREFPLLQGLVIQKKGDNIFTDLGENLIKVQRRLIIFRDIPVNHPVSAMSGII